MPARWRASLAHGVGAGATPRDRPDVRRGSDRAGSSTRPMPVAIARTFGTSHRSQPITTTSRVPNCDAANSIDPTIEARRCCRRRGRRTDRRTPVEHDLHRRPRVRAAEHDRERSVGRRRARHRRWPATPRCRCETLVAVDERRSATSGARQIPVCGIRTHTRCARRRPAASRRDCGACHSAGRRSAGRGSSAGARDGPGPPPRGSANSSSSSRRLRPSAPASRCLASA